MLKIKFNINEFTKIFLRRFEGKNERKRISFNLYQFQRPLSCFSVSFLLQPPFLLQHLFFFSVSALFFLLQRPLFFLFLFLFRRFSFYFSIPFLFFFFFFSSPHFFFSFDVLPFFQPKILFQPKTFFNPRYFFSPKISPRLWFSASFFSSFSAPLFFLLMCCPFSSAPLFFCACLLLYSLPTSKAIKISSFGSVYPRPNILSNCFTSLLFE